MNRTVGRIRPRLVITLSALAILYAAAAHASRDATLCGRQVGKLYVACRADIRAEGLSGAAARAAAKLCRETRSARRAACIVRSNGQSAARTRTITAALLEGAAAASPTLTTDKFDYQPGDVITISSSGWESGEAVVMVLTVNPETHAEVVLTSVADDDGAFTNTDYTVQESDANVVFTLTATGQSSGVTVQTAGFTDSAPCNEGDGEVSNVVATDGGCVFQDSLPATAVEAWDVEQGKTYDVTLTNVTECSGSSIKVLVKSSDNGNQCLTATGSGGTYTFSITMPTNACNTFPIQYCSTCTSNSSPADGVFARRSDGGCKESHLRASTFGSDCSDPVADTDCTGAPPTPTSTPGVQTPTDTPANTPTDTPIPCLGSLTACKYEDDDADGANNGEPALSGWALTISPDPGGGQDATQNTGSNGCVTWSNLSCGSYTVTEAAPSGGNPWFNTEPGSSGPCLMVASGCPSPSQTVDVEGPSMTAFGNIQSGKIKVCKYEDLKANGVRDMGDPPLSDWTVDVTGENDASQTQSDQTGTDGCASFFVLPTITYTAGEGLGLQTGLPTWFNTDPGSGGVACLPSACPHPTKTGIGVDAGDSTTVYFGNVQGAEKHGEKFYDADGSGSITAGDGIVTGFKITLSGTAKNGSSVTTLAGNPASVPLTVYTDATGNYSFGPLLPGDYTVTETAPNSTWHNTTPLSNNFSLSPGDVLCGNDTESSEPSCTAFDTGDDFGNVCVGAGGGLTLGWWSNKNGQAAITGADLCALTALNLRNANGSVFDPVPACPPNPTSAQINSGKTALKNWLLSANATNMAYMLSAQLATMKLNVIQPIGSSSVNGNALIFVGTPPNNCVAAVNSFGFITINDLMNAANSISTFSLASFGNTTMSGAARTCQDFMKTALDKANNNLNFVQSGPQLCPFTSPY